jgi:cobyrinic acid a,c-diamide synthase
VIEHYTDVPVLGAVAEDARLALAERHLGLVPCAETEGPRAWVAEVGRIVAAQVDLAAVRELAASAAPWPHPAAAAHAASAAPRAAPRTAPRTAPRNAARAGVRERLRIGIAHDRAFGFYYPDDLSALEAAGAELVFFDALHDRELPPALAGLFIGGGFPETCMRELEANTALRGALHEAISGGLPAYAECGGLMYLSRSIRFGGASAQMVGVIPGDAVMQPRPVGRGYVQLEPTAAMPWPGVGSGPVRGHEFHHASLDDLDPGVAFAWRVTRGHGIDGVHDGVVLHNLLASFSHLRQGAGSDWARRFMSFVQRVAAERRPSPRAAQAGLALSQRAN